MLIIFAIAALLIAIEETKPKTGGSSSAPGAPSNFSQYSQSQLPQYLSDGEIAAYAKNAGFSGSDVATAVAIARAESSGNRAAVGDKTLAPAKGPSIGLWQIDIGDDEHPEYAGMDLTDPQVNAFAAYALYVQAGYSFSPWSSYGNGKYYAFLNDAESAVLA